MFTNTGDLGGMTAYRLRLAGVPLVGLAFAVGRLPVRAGDATQGTPQASERQARLTREGSAMTFAQVRAFVFVAVLLIGGAVVIAVVIGKDSQRDPWPPAAPRSGRART